MHLTTMTIAILFVQVRDSRWHIRALPHLVPHSLIVVCVSSLPGANRDLLMGILRYSPTTISCGTQSHALRLVRLFISPCKSILIAYKWVRALLDLFTRSRDSHSCAGVDRAAHSEQTAWAAYRC